MSCWGSGHWPWDYWPLCWFGFSELREKWCSWIESASTKKILQKSWRVSWTSEPAWKNPRTCWWFGMKHTAEDSGACSNWLHFSKPTKMSHCWCNRCLLQPLSSLCFFWTAAFGLAARYCRTRVCWPLLAEHLFLAGLLPQQFFVTPRVLIWLRASCRTFDLQRHNATAAPWITETRKGKAFSVTVRSCGNVSSIGLVLSKNSRSRFRLVSKMPCAITLVATFARTLCS